MIIRIISRSKCRLRGYCILLGRYCVLLRWYCALLGRYCILLRGTAPNCVPHDVQKIELSSSCA